MFDPKIHMTAISSDDIAWKKPVETFLMKNPKIQKIFLIFPLCFSILIDYIKPAPGVSEVFRDCFNP